MNYSPGLTNTLSGTTNVDVVQGFNPPLYDYIANTSTTTSDTFVFKVGGSGGATVMTVAFVYTDTTKATISTITKT
jgi:hypothetical protein